MFVVVLAVEGSYMCRSTSCVKCGRSLVVAPCEVWGRCVLLCWQWSGNLCVDPSPDYGFLIVSAVERSSLCSSF